VTVSGHATHGGIVGAVRTGGSVRAATVDAGPRRTAVVLINFADDLRQPWSVDQVRQRVFTAPDSTNAFFQEESYGQVSLTGKLRADGDVLGWYTLPTSSRSCNPDLWATLAQAAVRTSGANLTGYDHVVFAFPPEQSCQWSGLGELPGTQSWVNGDVGVKTIAHELEHNMGTHHASSYKCTSATGDPVAMSGNCSVDEYGDPFDVMGGFLARHSSAWHLQQLGFLPGSHVQTVRQTGTYTVQSALAQGAPTQLIRIPRTRNPDGSVRDYYYLDLRTGGGIFDNFSATDPAVTGVAIRICQDSSELSQSWLIDTTPGSPGGFGDAPLAAGRTFDDGTIAISNTGVAGGSATLKITVRSQPDTQPPSAPGGITATTQGDGLHLNWQASTDDFQVASYRVERDGQEIGTTSTPSFVDPGVRVGGAYTYEVIATDTAGNSSQSAPFTLTVSAQSSKKKNAKRKGPVVRIKSVRGRHGKRKHVLRATASGKRRVKRVELWIDGKRRASAAGSQLTFQWTALRGRKGPHSVLVRAVDASGATGSRTLRLTSRPLRAKLLR
jgi:chitodextrinase